MTKVITSTDPNYVDRHSGKYMTLRAGKEIGWDVYRYGTWQVTEDEKINDTRLTNTFVCEV